jgi:DNA-binding NtrC family response regulator
MNILIVDDDDTLRGLLARELARSGHGVTQAADAAQGLASVAAAEPDVMLLDLMLPDQSGIDVLRQVKSERPALPVVMLTAHSTVDTALAAMKLGAYDYLKKPCHLQELEITLQRALERRRLGEENARLREGLSTGSDPDWIGSGKAFEELRRFVAKVAPSDSTVLLRGETGTGKEMLARRIHRLSPRREQPFVVVDCASLQESLLQSELFGHEKGAFTGAVRLKHGLFEAADGGTAFLDEVGDVSPAVQAGLLRVLETSTFRRLGGTRELHVDVRLIAATNRDLERLMREGQFRQDLFFRLNAVQIEIPPLRQRQDDVASLLAEFLARHNARCGTSKRFAPETLEGLRSYRWPGNVRELRHVVERAAVLADGDLVGPADLPAEVRRESERAAAPLEGEALPLADVERRHIARVLAQMGGHRARAARALGISERSLYRKLIEYDLNG